MRHGAGEPARAPGSGRKIGAGFGPARFGVGVAMRTIDVRVRTPTTFATMQIPRMRKKKEQETYGKLAPVNFIKACKRTIL